MKVLKLEKYRKEKKKILVAQEGKIYDCFEKKREQELEEKVLYRYEEGILGRRDLDLKALGFVSEGKNAIYNLIKANFAMSNDLQIAFKYLARINNHLETEYIAENLVYIYPFLASEGIISLEDLGIFLEGAVSLYPTLEILNMAGKIYLEDLKDFKRAYGMGKLLREKYKDSSLVREVMKAII